jgi:hypothetical protein
MNGGSEVKYFDGCIYFFNGNSYGRQENHATLYRFNIMTGNITTVCPDPLCAHNTPDCPFYAMDPDYYVYKNKIYYGRTFYFDIDFKDLGFSSDFVSFDISESKLKQYYSSEDISGALIGSELYVDKYRFYYDAIVDTKINTVNTTINRMNLEDGSIDVLKVNSSFKIGSNDSTNFGDKFLFAIGQRIYFTDGMEIYSTDFNMNDRQDIISGAFISSKILTDGEYIYWGESEDSDNTNFKTLYRTKLDGSGEKSSIGIITEDWQLTKNYIYYLNLSWSSYFVTVYSKDVLVNRRSYSTVCFTTSL